MTTTYMIIDDRELFNDELLTRETLFDALPYCSHSAKVLAFDMDEALSGTASTIRNVTEDVVLEAYAEGAFAGYEDARDGIAGNFITFPITREQWQADNADHLRDLQHEAI